MNDLNPSQVHFFHSSGINVDKFFMHPCVKLTLIALPCPELRPSALSEETYYAFSALFEFRKRYIISRKIADLSTTESYIGLLHLSRLRVLNFKIELIKQHRGLQVEFDLEASKWKRPYFSL